MKLKEIIRKSDKPLFFISLLLFIIGLIMIFSSSSITAYMKYSVSPYRYFIKQTGFLLVSFLICLFGVVRFHTKSYKILGPFLVYGTAIILCLLLVYGSVKNDAISWINLGFMSIQPSEFVKIFTIMWLASYYDSNKEKLGSYLVVLYPILICLIVAGFIFVQPDLGTMIIYSVIVAFLFFLSPISKEIRNKVLMLLVSFIVIIA